MILPLRNMVLFPGVQVPLLIGRESSIKLVEESWQKGKIIGIVTQKDPEKDDPGPEDLYSVGTLAKIMGLTKEDKGFRILVEGIKRFKIVRHTLLSPYLLAEVEMTEEVKVVPETEEMMEQVKKSVSEMLKRLSMPSSVAKAIEEQVKQSSHPGQLADRITLFAPFDIKKKQEILETIDVKERLGKLSNLLQEVKVGIDVRQEAGKEVFKTQRAFWLHEQIKAAQKELKEMGEKVDTSPEMADLREKIEKAQMPEEARKVAEKELDRLEHVPPAAAEYTVIRTYLDWLIEIPWSKSTVDNLDINQAEKILDEDHYDLEKIKKRILEYLAVRQLNPGMKGPILCLVGPPGTGKTSLGRSIARALERKFVRISLGGVRDEAEIRGHRRTYIGALPGRIIQQIKKSGSNNPVFMIDEIDKIGSDWRGDPSSALLEALDPEQNFSFSDHYLEVPFDLSKVMFIGTANLEDPILPALKDRLEILRLSGYTREEKLKIAKQFLIPRQLEEHGLSQDSLKLEDEAVEVIIRDYTREAGVRNLEREIASCCRGVAKKIATKEITKARISVKDLHGYLGPLKYFSELAERTSKPGVAIGLAWTQYGGEILFIEATKMECRGEEGEKFVTTGHLGEVMIESIEAARSFLWSNAKYFGIEPENFEKSRIHLHVPSGATPKDGPSAGITMFIALVSLLTQRPTREEVAMTGEITLRGRVLPVGGIKEKVLAAKEAGIKVVILPKKNEKDLEEIPKEVKEALEFKFVEEMEKAIEIALEKSVSK
jgi:ATP-dependent Lon protease